MVTAAGLLVLTDVLEEPFGGVLFTLPIAATAVLALALGAGPGVVATAVICVGFWYLFQPPQRSFELMDHREMARQPAVRQRHRERPGRSGARTARRTAPLGVAAPG